MKISKFIGKPNSVLAVALALACGSAMTSCVDSDDDEEVQKMIYTYSFESTSGFNNYGMWDDCYNTSIQSIAIQPSLSMSHYAKVDTYDGVEYKSWKGFCPSRGNDGRDHSQDNWTNYQWNSITGNGAAASMDYIVACWDVQETTNALPSDPSCAIALAEGTRPLAVSINNSAWGYYAMKNGSAFNRAFTDQDWCKVIFKSVVDRHVTGTVEVYLAKDGKIIDEWTNVDLTPLGETSYIIVQMESSDSGQWGMNNPAYFCLDNLRVELSIKIQ